MNNNMGIEEFLEMHTDWVKKETVTDVINEKNEKRFDIIQDDHYMELLKEGIEFDYTSLYQEYCYFVLRKEPDLSYCIEQFQRVDKLDKTEYEYYDFAYFGNDSMDIYSSILSEILNYCLSIWVYGENASAQAFLQGLSKKIWTNECKQLSKYNIVNDDTIMQLLPKEIDGTEEENQYITLLLILSLIMGYPMADECKALAAYAVTVCDNDTEEYKNRCAKKLRLPNSERIAEKMDILSNIDSSDNRKKNYFDLISGLCGNKGKTGLDSIQEYTQKDEFIVDIATACARMKIRSRDIEHLDGDALQCIGGFFNFYYSERNKALSVIKILISNQMKEETDGDILQADNPIMINEDSEIKESSEAVNQEIKDLRAIIRKKDGIIRQQRELYEEEKRSSLVKESLQDEYESLRKELAALRKFAYEITDNEDLVVPEKEEVISSMKQELKEKRIVIIGGYQNWVNKMKQEFPNWKFFSPGATSTIPTSDIESADAVFFHTSCLAHAQYYKYVGVAKRRSIKLGYLSKSSVEEDIIQIHNDVFNQ